jgi:hypothetical protein
VTRAAYIFMRFPSGEPGLDNSLQLTVVNGGKRIGYGRSLASLSNREQTRYALRVQARRCGEAVR